MKKNTIATMILTMIGLMGILVIELDTPTTYYDNQYAAIAEHDDEIKYQIATIQKKDMPMCMECEETESDENTEMVEAIEWYKGYITTTVNVRTNYNTDSEIVSHLYFGDVINYFYVDDSYEWCGFYYKDKLVYVSGKYVVGEPCDSKTFNVPDYEGFKSWMKYTSITTRSSRQYKLQQNAYTGNYGIRMIGNRYCVALGSYFSTDIGKYFDIVLKNGTVIKCVLADAKADIHTEQSNMFTNVGKHLCCSEFVVDYRYLDKRANSSGDMSTVCDEWNSPVKHIIMYEKNYFD